MTTIKKKYWKWSKEQSIGNIRLGQSIDVLLENGAIQQLPGEDSLYEGEDGYPWRISSARGKVSSIFCRERFFDLLEEGIWELEIAAFSARVNDSLEEIEPNGSESCYLKVAFRGGFVAIAGIELRNDKKEP